jgi:hypothetical protein
VSNRRAKSMIALVGLAFLLGFIAWLDSARGGPATALSRCNLALARAEMPAADVLLIGSSRSGVAFDPVAIQNVLQHETGRDLSVERIAIGNITLRVSEALFETYLQRRGAPKILVLEATFMTPRTVKRLASAARGQPSEHYLLARDLNLMTFAQLMGQPAVAMPYTEPETTLEKWRLRLRGVISRAGALVYLFAKSPVDGWSASDCSRTDFTREPTWPEDFSFAFGDYHIEGGLSHRIAALRVELELGARFKTLQAWQVDQPEDGTYPYDFEATYRQGELTYFLEIVRHAQTSGASVLVLPMPLYGYEIDPRDVKSLETVLPPVVEIIDIYDMIGADFSTFWYDDAHIQQSPTGVLTSALLSERLVSIIREKADRD